MIHYRYVLVSCSTQFSFSVLKLFTAYILIYSEINVGSLVPYVFKHFFFKENLLSVFSDGVFAIVATLIILDIW